MNKLAGVTVVTGMRLPASAMLALIEKGVEVIEVEDTSPELDFDNIIPENAPLKIEDYYVPSGKKKAQWKSEINGRKHI